jgi:DNA-binding XRE family transcriptional regulator
MASNDVPEEFFNEFLRRLRLAARITQKNLAISIGVTPAQVNWWETGLFAPSDRTIARCGIVLADLLRVPAAELLRVHRETRAARRWVRRGSACGTRSGYVSHLWHGEDPCQGCRDANKAANKALYGRSPRKDVPAKRDSCGTPFGAGRHYYHNEPACDECREANNRYQEERRRAAGGQPMKLAACGTPTAYDRHKRRGERCDVCNEARAARQARSRKGKAT